QKITNGDPSGVSQFVNVPVGTENEDRTISFVSSMISGSAQSAMVISVGSTFGGNDLASQLFSTDNGEMVFNPNGITSYWITFSCFNNINIIRRY
ncbi:unnamed protein product, partial [marine sediment metagenome]